MVFSFDNALNNELSLFHKENLLFWAKNLSRKIPGLGKGLGDLLINESSSLSFSGALNTFPTVPGPGKGSDFEEAFGLAFSSFSSSFSFFFFKKLIVRIGYSTFFGG